MFKENSSSLSSSAPKNAMLSQNQCAIYLAGSIQKGSGPSNELFWTATEMEELRASLPSLELSFLNPALRMDDLSLQMAVFGRDMLMVYCSDFVLVDVRQKRGLGVGAEMMWAKMNKIPVISYAPQESHHRKSKASILKTEVDDWIHPFVECLSDHIAASLADAAEWIQKHIHGETNPVKDAEFIRQAMALYRSTQYERDLPMRELIENSARLSYRATHATGYSASS